MLSNMLNTGSLADPELTIEVARCHARSRAVMQLIQERVAALGGRCP